MIKAFLPRLFPPFLPITSCSSPEAVWADAQVVWTTYRLHEAAYETARVDALLEGTALMLEFERRWAAARLPSVADAAGQSQMQVCLRVLRDMMRLPIAELFSKPADNLLIEHPMDLGTVEKKLVDGAYR